MDTCTYFFFDICRFLDTSWHTLPKKENLLYFLCYRRKVARYFSLFVDDNEAQHKREGRQPGIPHMDLLHWGHVSPKQPRSRDGPTVSVLVTTKLNVGTQPTEDIPRGFPCIAGSSATNSRGGRGNWPVFSVLVHTKCWWKPTKVTR